MIGIFEFMPALIGCLLLGRSMFILLVPLLIVGCCEIKKWHISLCCAAFTYANPENKTRNGEKSLVLLEIEDCPIQTHRHF